jgi:hypothetical protein
LYHYTHHVAHLLHHHFQLLVELNLQVLGQNHFYLAAVFEEEHVGTPESKLYRDVMCISHASNE